MSKDKEFFLHSKTVAQGRDTIANLVKPQVTGISSFPPATPGVLAALLANVEHNADQYTEHAEGGKWHTDAIFDFAVAASSWATAAAELALDFKWVSRLDYAPAENEKSGITTEMRKFAKDVNRLLNVMYKLAVELRDSDALYPDTAGTDRLLFERRQRIQQALYLAELGVRITVPQNYKYNHPDACKWLDLRARVRRVLRDALDTAANLDEQMARDYRGKTER